MAVTIEYWTGSAWSSATTIPNPWTWSEDAVNRSTVVDTTDGYRAVVTRSGTATLTRITATFRYTTQSDALYDTLKAHKDNDRILRLKTGTGLDDKTYIVRIVTLAKEWVVVNGQVGYDIRVQFEEMPTPTVS